MHEKFVCYQLKPFREEEKKLPYREGLLENFFDIKTNLTFYIVWNSKKIKIFVKIPHNIKDFFENVFYAAFQNCEIVKNIKLDENKKLYKLKHW